MCKAVQRRKGGCGCGTRLLDERWKFVLASWCECKESHGKAVCSTNDLEEISPSEDQIHIQLVPAFVGIIRLLHVPMGRTIDAPQVSLDKSSCPNQN